MVRHARLPQWEFRQPRKKANTDTAARTVRQIEQAFHPPVFDTQAKGLESRTAHREAHERRLLNLRWARSSFVFGLIANHGGD